MMKQPIWHRCLPAIIQRSNHHCCLEAPPVLSPNDQHRRPNRPATSLTATCSAPVDASTEAGIRLLHLEVPTRRQPKICWAKLGRFCRLLGGPYVIVYLQWRLHHLTILSHYCSFKGFEADCFRTTFICVDRHAGKIKLQTKCNIVYRYQPSYQPNKSGEHYGKFCRYSLVKYRPWMMVPFAGDLSDK